MTVNEKGELGVIAELVLNGIVIAVWVPIDLNDLLQRI